MDLRGRSRTLRINDRSSHQIRSQADQLLDPESRDVDGNVRVRRGDGLTPREFAIFVPSEAELPRAEAALRVGGAALRASAAFVCVQSPCSPG